VPSSLSLSSLLLSSCSRPPRWPGSATPCPSRPAPAGPRHPWASRRNAGAGVPSCDNLTGSPGRRGPGGPARGTSERGPPAWWRHLPG